MSRLVYCPEWPHSDLLGSVSRTSTGLKPSAIEANLPQSCHPPKKIKKKRRLRLENSVSPVQSRIRDH